MARTRTFDPVVALDRAVTLFWRRGFGGTSMDDLVRETGVSRYGLYGTFGDKQDLFLRALARYRTQVIEPLVSALEAPGAGRGELEVFFGRVAEWLGSPLGRRGCLMCNTAVELGAADEASARLVGAHFERLRKAFEGALRTARRRGEVPAGVQPRRAADLLLAVVQGAFVMARGGQHPATVQALLRTAMQAVERWGGAPSRLRRTRARRNLLRDKSPPLGEQG